MKDLTKRLRERIKEIVGCIELNRSTQNFMKAAISGKGDFSVFTISDCRQKLPERIEEGKGLRGEYQKLTGKRYTSLVIGRYWKSSYD